MTTYSSIEREIMLAMDPSKFHTTRDLYKLVIARLTAKTSPFSYCLRFCNIAVTWEKLFFPERKLEKLLIRLADKKAIKSQGPEGSSAQRHFLTDTGKQFHGIQKKMEIPPS